MELLINPEEILDLIAEVGQTLLLCDRTRTHEPDPVYGSPLERAVTTRPIRGYVVPEGFKEIQIVSNNELRSGGYIAYVIEVDLNRKELTERSFIAFEGRMYPLEYLQGVTHRGVVLLHKIRLLRPVSSVAQPDPVIQWQ